MYVLISDLDPRLELGSGLYPGLHTVSGEYLVKGIFEHLIPWLMPMSADHGNANEYLFRQIDKAGQWCMGHSIM